MQLELLLVMYEFFDRLFQELNEEQQVLNDQIFLYQLLQMLFRHSWKIFQARKKIKLNFTDIQN
jgi:hypothetical protein